MPIVRRNDTVEQQVKGSKDMSVTIWEQHKDDYIASLVGKSPDTRTRIGWAINALSNSDVPCTETVLEDFYVWRANRVKQTTALTDVAYIRGYLRYLVRHRIVDLNLEECTAIFKDIRPRVSVHSPDIDRNIDKLLAELEPRPRKHRARRAWLRDRALFSLLYYTGLRRAEIASLTRLQASNSERGVRIIGKGNKERVVFLHPHTTGCIAAYLRERIDNSDALFVKHTPSEEGRPLDIRALAYLVSSRAKKVGVDAHTHSFRHAYARTSLENGMRLEELQDLMGHASPATTKMIYGRFSTEHLAAAAQRGWGLDNS